MRAQQVKPLLRLLGKDTRVDDLRARDIHEDDRLVEGERLAKGLRALQRNERLRRVVDARLPYTAARLAEGASYNTLKKELFVLRRILEGCASRNELTVPVASLLPPKWSARYRPRTTVLIEGQAHDLLDALPPGHRRASIAFLIATGARRSEWWRAKPYLHLDFINETITLLGTKTKMAHRTFWMSPVSRPFLEICIRELPTVPEEEKAAFGFTRWTNVRRDLIAACDKAGVPRVTLNDLRRTFATLQARGGIAREDLVHFMGHVDDTMLRRIYDQTDEADHVRAARARYLRDHGSPGPANAPDAPASAGERRSA
jgi:integrase